MSLKEMLNAQMNKDEPQQSSQMPTEQSNTAEVLQTVQKLTAELQQKDKLITELRQTLQNEQSANQELLSTVTTLQSENAKLTERAACVNNVQLQNERLQRETSQAEAKAAAVDDRIEKVKTDAQRRIDDAVSRASAAEARAREAKIKQEAAEEARDRDGRICDEETTRARTIAIFSTLFAVFVVLFNLFSQRAAWANIGAWFADRWDGLRTAALFVWRIYNICVDWLDGVAGRLISNELACSIIGYSLIGIVFVVVIIGAAVLLMGGVAYVAVEWNCATDNCKHKGTKLLVALFLSLALLYVFIRTYAIWFMGMNIMATWLRWSVAITTLLFIPQLFAFLRYIKKELFG